MLYPVGVGGVLLGSAYSPAAAIINNGPGNLYLYRNSAVSRNIYDTVIGPNGSFQWPGGELWGVSDNAASVVNVLPGLTSFDSGTTQVAGTVSVAGGSSAPLPRIAASNSGSGSGFFSTPLPTPAKVGDVFLAFMTQNTNGQWPQGNQDGLFTQLMQVGGTTLWQRTATSDDLAGRNVQWSQGNGITCQWQIACVTTVKTVTLAGTGGTKINTGQVTGPIFIMEFASAGTPAWGNAANGGPSDPQAWSTNGFLGVSTISAKDSGDFAMTLSAANTSALLKAA